jgi:hypothetical protein
VGWRGRDRGRRGVERECVSVRGGGKRKKERGDEQGWGGERVRLIVSGEIVRGRGRERGREGGGGWRESETDCERKGGDRGKGGREI